MFCTCRRNLQYHAAAYELTPHQKVLLPVVITRYIHSAAFEKNIKLDNICVSCK